MNIEFSFGVLIYLGACQRSPSPMPGKSDAALPPPLPVASASASGAPDAAIPRSRAVFAFDMDAPGAAPKGFAFGRTGRGRPGRWVVQANTAARSAPHVLVQLDTAGSVGVGRRPTPSPTSTI